MTRGTNLPPARKRRERRPLWLYLRDLLDNFLSA